MHTSAKLLAEFDNYYQSPQSQQRVHSASPVGGNSGSACNDLACLDDKPAQPSCNAPMKLSNGSLSRSQPKHEMKALHSSHIGKVKDASLTDKFTPPKKGSKTVAPKIQNRESDTESDVEVLLDAFEEMGNADDEDDFGDFESGVQVAQPAMSDRSLMSNPEGDLREEYTEQGSQGSRCDLTTLSSVRTPPSSGLQEHDPPQQSLISIGSMTGGATPNTACPSITVSRSHLNHGTRSDSCIFTEGSLTDDGWGEFEDAADTVVSPGVDFSKTLPPTSIPVAASLDAVKPRARDSRTNNPMLMSPTTKAGCLSPVLELASSLNAKPSQPLQQSAAPLNIPPPSILVPLVTTVLQDYYNTIASFRDRGTHCPAETTPIFDLLQLVTVAAHIIAGREIRWKRDMLLAQNMRIGPSHSGRAGGMKLTGIDKAETLREDREVIDLLRVWKDLVGRVRSAVGVTTSIPTSIPDLAEIMPVKAAKGVLTSKKGCALCGLKREERVDKVDQLVEDSFGEWWIEHWGHTTCKWFWDRQHGALRQR
jgi:hypothetical protein